MIIRPLSFLRNTVRSASTKPVTNGEIRPQVYNRNPRNLERLGIQYKPCGYPLDKVNLEFWHKLEILRKKDFVTAQLIHNTRKIVVTASTNEWGIYKHLNSKNNKMAYIVLARVFAERCLESGIYSFACDIPLDESKNKTQEFLRILEEEGLSLKEMPRFDIHDIWYKKREKRPWTVLED